MNKINRIGIIFCAYNCAGTVMESLRSWSEIKQKYPDQFVYSCISIPFKQYEDFELPEDNTIELVHAANIMDIHFTEPEYLTEIEARGLCLKYLKEQNCDTIWMVDNDEIYTVEEINNIINYIDQYPQIAWFRLSLKNYTFDKNSYLADPFTPPRIFRTNFPPFKLGLFRDDNNLLFNYDGKEVWDECLPNKTIPKSVAWIKHLSWLSNETSKNKVKYQKSRGWNCSYEWDEINNKLIFNPVFYRGKQLPKVYKE